MKRGEWDRITLDHPPATVGRTMQSLDEIVVSNCTVHLERMDDGWYFLGIHDADELLIQAGVGIDRGSRKRRVVAWVYGIENEDGIAIEDGAVS